MSALSLASPFPIFTDIDGDPLDSGYIYVGEAGLNAETNPIQVYWDAGLTVPAAQPIRTLNGYASRNGAPAVMYIDSDDASILVKNKNASLVFSALNQTQRISASLATFTQSGTGAVATTVQAKLREFVSVKDFGAVGDGATDDTAAIQAAITAANAGCGVLYFPEGTYRYTPAGTFTTMIAGNGLTLFGDQGRSIIETDYNGVVFKFNTKAPALYFNIKGLLVEGLDFQNLDYNTTNTNATAIYVHKDNEFGADIEVRNCNFSRYSYCGVHVIRGYNCRFINTSFSGVAYRDSTTFPQTETEAGIRMWGADGTLTSQDHSFSNLCRIENCKFDYLYIGVDIWGSDRTNLISNSTFQACQIGIELKGNNATSGTSTNITKAGFGLAQLTVDNCWFELVWKAFVGNLINSTTGLFYAPGAYPGDATVTQGTVFGALNNYYATTDMLPADAVAPVSVYAPVTEGVIGSGTVVKYFYGQSAAVNHYRFYSNQFYVNPAATFASRVVVENGGQLVNASDATVQTLQRDSGSAANTAQEFKGASTSWFAGMNAAGEYGINWNSANLAAPYFKIDPDSNITMTLTTAAPALVTNKTFMMELTSNTNLRIHVRGSDGVNRKVDLTLS